MQERFLDVSHEALIRGWPRLRGWLDEDRAGLRLQRRITETADEWQRSNRDNDLLYRGARLIQAQEWRERHEVELNPLEREFLDASIALKQRLEEREREQQQRELEATQKLAEAEQRRAEEKRRVNLLRRQRNFGAIVLILGVIVLIAGAGFYLVLSEQVREHVEKGRSSKKRAKADLLDEMDPIRNITALRNLAVALNFNRKDTEAAKMARDLLLQHIWCPPAAPEVRYQDTLLAATFAPEGSNNETFAAAGDGQLLFCNGRELLPVQSLFKKPKPDVQHVVQPGFASFSPDGQWLFIIPPTLASAANAEAAGQGRPQQGVIPPASGGHEPCKLQIWRWSSQNRTYESAGEDLEIQRLRGSRIFNFAWSNESDRVVLINVRGTNEAECAFFEVEGKTFRELVDRSKELNRQKIVALAFAAHRTGMAAVSVDSAAPTLRNVSFIGDDLQILRNAMAGKDSIGLSEGFLPDGVAFGPGNDQITLASLSGVRILDLRGGMVTPIPPPTFRDQFMRIVPGPWKGRLRLVAKSLYGRVELAQGTQEPAEPVVFSGSIGIPQFSPDGQRLLILSGGILNVFDRMRLIDVSPLYRTKEATPETFEENPAPPWLAEIASAASAFDAGSDGSLLTLEAVRERYPESKAGNAYEPVWKRFFPGEKSNGR